MAARTIWQAPAVDPKLGLIYFSTGNAGSDWFGGDRPGKNLYAASIVALDLKTGTLKWYFQQVHHDIWDLDSASPVVLFDAGGKQGIAQASKTGWLYMLDRATGKPLYGIPEKPVPQNAEQKTWPTQPIPTTASSPRTAPCRPRTSRASRSRPSARSRRCRSSSRKVPFTPPPPGKLLIYGNGPQGGVNWQPISLQPADADDLRLLVGLVGRLHGEADTVRAAGPELHRCRRRRRRRLARRHRHVHRDRRDERQDRLAEGIPGALLLGHRDDRRQPRLHRPKRRRARRPTTPRPATCSGASRPAPARTTRRRSSSRRQAVHRLPRRRQLARRDPARRQPLALRPRRHARPGAAPGKGAGTSTKAKATRQRQPTAPPATPPQARPSSPTTASPATAPTATAATAAPT